MKTAYKCFVSGFMFFLWFCDNNYLYFVKKLNLLFFYFLFCDTIYIG